MESWAPPSALCWSTLRSSEVTPKCSQPPPYSPRGPPELEVWNGDLKARPSLFTKILPLSSLPVLKQAETSLHCVGGDRPTPGFMALGESESTLDRWPQEGHNSCLTFDSLGLPHPHLTLEMLSPSPQYTPHPTRNCRRSSQLYNHDQGRNSLLDLSFLFFFSNMGLAPEAVWLKSSLEIAKLLQSPF